MTTLPLFFFRFLVLFASDFNSNLLRNSHFKAKEYTTSSLWKHQLNLFTVWSVFFKQFEWIMNAFVSVWDAGALASHLVTVNVDFILNFEQSRSRKKSKLLVVNYYGEAKSPVISFTRSYVTVAYGWNKCKFKAAWGTCVQAPPGLRDYRDQVPLGLPPVGGWSLHKRKWK